MGESRNPRGHAHLTAAHQKNPHEIRREENSMATEKPAHELLEANQDLNARDMRDLLMEYGATGTVASALVDDRLQAEWRASGQR
jgi:hypothetical protein